MEFARYKSSWAWRLGGSRKCQLFPARTSRQTWGVAMLLSSTRVRRDRTSIAFVPSRCDVTIDLFRETQLRRRGGALPLNPRPLGRFDRYSRRPHGIVMN